MMKIIWSEYVFLMMVLDVLYKLEIFYLVTCLFLSFLYVCNE